MPLLLALLTALSPPALAADAPKEAPAMTPTQMPLTALDGTLLSKEVLDGKVVLFVNVASRCGFTPQYTGLQALYDGKKDDGLVVVGVPCNQFGAQEPGAAEQIATFCQRNYGVTFPLLEKQPVNGGKRSALYQYLVDSEAGGGTDVRWNFEKFLVGKDGAVLGRFASDVEPDAAELVGAIDSALK